VGVRSWSAIKLVYNLAQYSWSTKGFSYKASYNFITDGKFSFRNSNANSSTFSASPSSYVRPKNFYNSRGRNSLEELFAIFLAELFLPSELCFHSRFEHRAAVDD
jgi:hypothetical protein